MLIQYDTNSIEISDLIFCYFDVSTHLYCLRIYLSLFCCIHYILCNAILPLYFTCICINMVVISCH